MKRIPFVVIGAGVVGLAIARRLAQSGEHVWVLEAHNAVGRESSFRNSAVIHAGIYYSQKTLKSKLCVPGRDALYAYCQQRDIPTRKLGKLIVATQPEQLSTLEHLEKQAKANGVDDLQWLDQKAVQKREPHVKCKAALFSPSTGIVHGHRLLNTLAADVIDAGGEIHFNASVRGGEVLSSGFRLQVGRGDQTTFIEADNVINAAGLWSTEVARTMTGIPDYVIPRTYYAKGNYFRLKGKAPFSHLVYPVPEKAGLGIHATIGWHEELRFGPDVEWTTDLDYRVSTHRKAAFLKAIKCYFPAIEASHLSPEFTGIRPKIKPEGEQPQDFLIQSPTDHGVNGWTNLSGIESPGLTASLAIADYVKQRAL